MKPLPPAHAPTLPRGSGSLPDRAPVTRVSALPVLRRQSAPQQRTLDLRPR